MILHYPDIVFIEDQQNNTTFFHITKSHDCLLNFLVIFLDIDECKGDNDCDVNSKCTNTDGSFTCACRSGYKGDGKTCEGNYLAFYSMTCTFLFQRNFIDYIHLDLKLLQLV